MKIARIEVRFVEAELDQPFGWSQRWTNTRSVVVLKVFTDDGVIGWGETYGSSETVTVIASIARLAIGENPENISQIWHKIHRATFQSHMYTGAAVMAASAIDTALHDIVGESKDQHRPRKIGGNSAGTQVVDRLFIQLTDCSSVRAADIIRIDFQLRLGVDDCIVG